MADALTAINLRATPQTEQADPRQKLNNAGGYTFQVSDESRIHRFLTLGTDGGTYYATERDLTQDNAQVVLAAARNRGQWLVERAVEISTAGRAPRQNPAIFALAAAASVSDDTGRAAAFAAVPEVCRIGTHLYLFARYCAQMRGWGRGLRHAVGGWYMAQAVDRLAYQLVKYRQREGISHRDLLRLAHPAADTPARRALFNWVCTGDTAISNAPGDGTTHEQRPVGATRDDLPALIGAFEEAQSTTQVARWVELIEAHPLSWEMLPDAALTNPKVWMALVNKGMPQTALVRQLPRLTRLGVLDDRDVLQAVTTQLTDGERLRKGRVHPMNILLAQRTYAQGKSMQGSSEWTPKRQVIDALDAAFYTAYGAIEAANKRTLLALDVSGSMGNPVHGAARNGRPQTLPITCREASAALTLTTMNSEPQCDVVGFTSKAGQWGWSRDSELRELSLSPRQRLDDAVRAISNLPFGGTDCSLPMIWAAANKREYDTIVIYTDNETWAGRMHPHQALQAYRNETGIPTRLCVVALTPTPFTIADPADPGSLDIAGLDSSVPNLVADFSRGSV